VPLWGAAGPAGEEGVSRGTPEEDGYVDGAVLRGVHPYVVDVVAEAAPEGGAQCFRVGGDRSLHEELVGGALGEPPLEA
jgi:hypothetical protein